MLLKSPVMITARLMPGVKIGDAFVSIEYSDCAGRDGRTRYRWFVDLSDGREFTDDDLQSGCGGGSLQAGLESLLSFLGAFAESWRRGPGGDNGDLFPEGLHEWATQNSDEIGMLAIELEETPDLIEESVDSMLFAGNIG